MKCQNNILKYWLYVPILIGIILITHINLSMLRYVFMFDSHNIYQKYI